MSSSWLETFQESEQTADVLIVSKDKDLERTFFELLNFCLWPEILGWSTGGPIVRRSFEIIGQQVDPLINESFSLCYKTVLNAAADRVLIDARSTYALLPFIQPIAYNGPIVGFVRR